MNSILKPLMPLKHHIYRCDNRFHLEKFIPYFTIRSSAEDVGLCIIYGEEATLYKINGTKCERLNQVTIHRRKRQTKGGQSAHRFQMLRLEQIQGFVKKIALAINVAFLSSSGQEATIKFFVVLGAGNMKDQVVDSSHLSKKLTSLIQLNHEVDNEISISSALGIIQTIESKISHNADSKKWLQIEEMLMTPNRARLVVYGYDAIRKYLAAGLVKKLILAADHVTQLKAEFQQVINLAESVEIWAVTDNVTFAGFGYAVALLYYDLAPSVHDEILH